MKANFKSEYQNSKQIQNPIFRITKNTRILNFDNLDLSRIFIFQLLASCLLLSASCGGGFYTGQTEQQPLVQESAEKAVTCSVLAPCKVDITRNAFILGSDFPADIVIPDIEGMRGTAFIATGTNPTGVIAIDLATNPLSVSMDFAGLVTPSGTGYPSDLFIMSPSRAFLLTSSHVIDFNPVTGAVNKSLLLNYIVTLSAPLPLSDSSSTVNEITPSYPSSIAAVDSKLYVTVSNYINPAYPAYAAPGMVLVFDIMDSEPYLKIRTYIITTDYNPSGITPLPNGTIAVTNSGVSDLINAHAVPKTNASIDIIDPSSDSIIANITAGTIGLSFQEIALTKDGRRGFIGSISYGEIYEIDLENYEMTHDHSSPITVTGNEVGSDYLTAQAISYDDVYLFASSFERSTVHPVDVGGMLPRAMPGHFIPEPFVVGFPGGVTEENPSGANTGAGPIAIRPGRPGKDFTGPDIFVTTGYPGTLVAINTNYKGAGKPAPAAADKPPPENTMELEPESESCAGFAEAVIDVKISVGGGMGFPKLPDVVLGPPEPPPSDCGRMGTCQSVNGIISLGPGGSITLDMGECEIADGEGPDFIVFENAFFTPIVPGLPEFAIEYPEETNVWSEPGIVSASEDNITYHAFPCDFKTAAGSGSFHDKSQSGCAGITPTLYDKDPLVRGLENGAGGDVFDLGTIGLKKAKYVKITSAGIYKKPADINNPGAGSGGFDLDAISVVNGVLPK